MLHVCYAISMNLLHNVACVLCNDTCDTQYIGGGVFGAELFIMQCCLCIAQWYRFVVQ